MLALFEEHRVWVEGIARKIQRKLPPSFALDDLIQEGMIEHWKRVQLYDPSGDHAGSDSAIAR